MAPVLRRLSRAHWLPMASCGRFRVLKEHQANLNTKFPQALYRPSDAFIHTRETIYNIANKHRLHASSLECLVIQHEVATLYALLGVCDPTETAHPISHHVLLNLQDSDKECFEMP